MLGGRTWTAFPVGRHLSKEGRQTAYLVGAECREGHFSQRERERERISENG